MIKRYLFSFIYKTSDNAPGFGRIIVNIKGKITDETIEDTELLARKECNAESLAIISFQRIGRLKKVQAEDKPL